MPLPALPCHATFARAAPAPRAQVEGFIEKDREQHFPPLKIGKLEVKRPAEVTKATLVKTIRGKYRPKAKADKILQFLAKVCNDYKDHVPDGSSYHSAKLLWDRSTDQKVTYEDMVDLFTQLALDSRAGMM